MFFNWSRKDQQGWSGNILTFTNSELGLKKPGENLHYLRDKLGTGPKTSSAQPAFRERVEQESTPAIVDPTRIRRTWSKMEPGHNSRYLIEERGLRPELLAPVSSDNPDRARVLDEKLEPRRRRVRARRRGRTDLRL